MSTRCHWHCSQYKIFYSIQKLLMPFRQTKKYSRLSEWGQITTPLECEFCIGFMWKLLLLSDVPDFFDRNKILSGGDLSHYQVPHCIRVFFFLFDLCLFITIFNFILNCVPIVTFWIFTYHKIWILLIIFCFIWNYWIIYFLTCLEVFWSDVS